MPSRRGAAAIRHFFVINPHSFRRQTVLNQVLLDIENSFSVVRRMDYKIYLSRYPRDAISAVQRYISGCGGETVRVYAIGGDGILFDCLNGMFPAPNAELAAVPYGVANNFLRGFGSHEGVHSAFRDIKALVSAPARKLDVISCGGSVAINCAAVALEARALHKAYSLSRKAGPKYARHVLPTAFKAMALTSLFDISAMRRRYSVTVDKEDLSGIYSSITISNGPCASFHYIVNPHAKPDDGYMDALLINEPSPLKLASAIPKIAAGALDDIRQNIFLKRACRELTIESPSLFYAMLDGEVFMTDKLALKLHPAALSFVAPAEMEFVSNLSGKGAPN